MIEFFVPGICSTAGSKSYMGRSKSGKAIMLDSNKRGPLWRAEIKLFAQAVKPDTLLMGPIRLHVDFIMKRPKSHFNNHGELKANALTCHTSKPDGTKMVRAIEDALKGLIWHDDSQIWAGDWSKTYGDAPGAKITIYCLVQHESLDIFEEVRIR